MQSYWPIIGEGNVVTLPKVPWVLNQTEQKRVKNVIGNFRTPTGHMHCLKARMECPIHDIYMRDTLSLRHEKSRMHKT